MGLTSTLPVEDRSTRLQLSLQLGLLLLREGAWVGQGLLPTPGANPYLAPDPHPSLGPLTNS